LDLVSLGSSMEEEDCPLVFLDQVHLFRGRVEALMDTPLPSAVALSVSPRAADYLQRHWPVVTIGGLDEAPVPRVCCCTGCGDPGAVLEAEPGNGQTAAVWDPGWWPLCVLSSGMMLLLVVMVLLIWILLVINHPDELHATSHLCQLLGLSSEMTTSILTWHEENYKSRLETEEAWRRSAEDLFMWVAAFFKT